MNHSYIRRCLSLALVAIACMAHAQAPEAAPEDLFKHLYWSGTGTRFNQRLGATGLDTIGYVNDTIQHAFALGTAGGSCYVFNRFPGDTACQYKFPGQKVIRGSMNGDKYPDFVCWDANAQKITVLFGTASPVVFDTALIIKGSGGEYKYIDGMITVGDCDDDGMDDLVVSDPNVTDSAGRYIGREVFFKGGTTMSPLPTISVVGNSRMEPIGGFLGICRCRDKVRPYLVEGRWENLNDDTATFRFFELGSKFSLSPSDTLVCDSHVGGGMISVEYMDVDGDSILDLIIGSAGGILAFKGGTTIAREPTYIFHKPFSTGSGTFGSKVIDIGDISGHGYHSILVTDPDASYGGLGNGVVTVFNIGRGLKDECVAFAAGTQGFDEALGSQVISLGDLDSDGLAEFAVAAVMDSNTPGGIIGSVGALYIFHGSPRFGPVVGVREHSASVDKSDDLDISPNPFSTNAVVRWPAPVASNEHAVLTICDVLGREVERIYDSVEGAQTNFIPLAGARLQAGTYLLRLACGGVIATRVVQCIR